MNKYPVWKYAVIVAALVVGFLYTLPNFFGEVPAVQVSGLRANKADADTRKVVEEALKAAKVDVTSVLIEGESLKVRFKDGEGQKNGQSAIQEKLGAGYIVALQSISNSPAWLSSINALPMYLGLDLRGGVLAPVDDQTNASPSLEVIQRSHSQASLGCFVSLVMP